MVRRWTWVAAFAATLVVATADWVAVVLLRIALHEPLALRGGVFAAEAAVAVAGHAVVTARRAG